ncbi:MAG: ATP-binding protein, partial [Oscillospiraceae bacterium]
TREPLTGIFSSVGILNRNIEDKSKYTEQCLKSITKNSYQILRGNLVLGEYLQYSYGCSTLSLTNKNISDFFIGVCVELENMMPSDIKFSYNIPNEGYVMAVDTEKLILVLANIVDNSCTFRNDENMSIILTVKYTGNNIIITVEDNGKGIPKEILPKIFAPYYSYVSKEIPFAGFGLGLTVSKLIIGHMGGTIAVSSEQGKGTTVAITIPNHRVAKSEMILRNRFTMTINNRFSPLTVIMSNSCDCPEM